MSTTYVFKTYFIYDYIDLCIIKSVCGVVHMTAGTRRGQKMKSRFCSQN